MMPSPTRLFDRLRLTARRWLPEMFVRVTRKDVEAAQTGLDEATEQELAAGQEAARKALAAARKSDRDL
jgi:hypothetical protein